jgi:hypothetical protein
VTKKHFFLAALFAAAALPIVLAQDTSLAIPRTIQAGDALVVSSSGSGNGTLYIVGPNQVLKRRVQTGEAPQIPPGVLIHAGHYLAILSTGSGAQSASFDVMPSDKPGKVSFLAEPSRLPVALHEGVAGAVYVFDRFGNLIVKPTPVTFQLTTPTGSAQTNQVVTRNGAAWTKMNTTPHEGRDSFMVRIGGISVTRLVHQVAGDPCGLSMSVHPLGKDLHLETAPVRDCSGNPVPDGTIVTFSETYDGSLSTADVPIKQGIAKVDLPAHPGGVLSVASGVVLGNQIRWEK